MFGKMAGQCSKGTLIYPGSRLGANSPMRMELFYSNSKYSNL